MEILTLILGIVSIVSLLLLGYEYRRRAAYTKKHETPTVDAEILSDHANTLIHSAIKKSEAIVSEAELAALRAMAHGKMQSQKFTGEYDKVYEDTVNQMYGQFNARITAVEAHYQEFITRIETSAKDNSQKIDAGFYQLIKSTGLKLDENMNKFLDETQKKSLQQLQMELSSARQMIDLYKNTQMRLVDENIMAVMERTLALVLSKNISLSDQLELITESFDQAKKEKFFI